MKKICMLMLLQMSLLLVSCNMANTEPINYSINEGKLSKDTKIISIDYRIDSTEGFYASIDFDLTDGKVEWEIINPKGEQIFEGYAAYENGRTYRELKYPQSQLNSHMNNKEEVKEGPDFNYLQFETGSAAGVYTLKSKPINSEGSYTIKWSDKLPRK